ncbi:chitin synthase [Nematocida minor]|uniref:chitin synthase n=1 Tax=Nematocida minor TaxID=1912983 RepID=UPI00221F752E|nr:chitin synthase [Nematocida minor]KAI5189489.1 chitin synthase [Nematocida minor]
MNSGETENNQVVLIPKRTLWQQFTKLCTSFIPSFILRLFGMKSKEIQSAWREKVALCWLIMFACLFLAFITYGLTMIVCIPKLVYTMEKMSEISEYPWVAARGRILKLDPSDRLSEHSESIVSSMFKVDAPSCLSAFPEHKIRTTGSLDMSNYEEIGPVHYTWSSILKNKLVVIGSGVYSVENVDLPAKLEHLASSIDATRASESLSPTELKCFKEMCYAGELALQSTGCQITYTFLYLSCAAILGLVLIRFFLAVAYSVIMKVKTWQLVRSTTDVIPVVLMTTCYSEGREGLKSTLDSLCIQEYDKKLIIVVADGFITGAGNDASTPEILKSLITPKANNPTAGMETVAKQYVSIAAGAAKLNHAEVHPGTYTVETKNGVVTTDIILILKTENRGKRDSQMIIMSFFHHILYSTRMTQLDMDLYKKIKHLTGMAPSSFEAILMVDADTTVQQGAVRIMSRTMHSDESIMGICGETLISNKFGSWVTAIQVFEYYVSHHLAKGFESVFGNVTCLPGCFCMYRIKLERKNGCTPILVSPTVLHAYGSDETKTLHEKNLLLLGEDRYLTTLLLKNYPKKKLVFVPSALCDTIVPDKFSVLLSQRRRWINSTIHNLFELLRVDLCGTFFCSMQYVVVLELFGTLVLPAAVLFTGVLIVSSIVWVPVWIPLFLLFAILGLPSGLIFFTNFNLFYFFWLVVYLISIPIWNFVLPVYAFWHFDDFSWGETRQISGGAPKEGHGQGGATEELDSSMKAVFVNFEDIEP